LDGVVIVVNTPCERVDIRNKPVAQFVVTQKNRLDSIIGPKFVVLSVAVGTKNRAEDPILEPPRIEFLKGWITLRTFIDRPISSNVGCPVRIAGQSKVQTCRNLVA
jgi:hypothetical protein